MNRKIALVGKSLSIDSVAAALEAVPGLELLRVDCSPADCLPSLQVLAPDAVVFDIVGIDLRDRQVLDLLTHPDLLLVGFDLATQQMLLLSGESARLTTVDDLAQALTAPDGRHRRENGVAPRGS